MSKIVNPKNPLRTQVPTAKVASRQDERDVDQNGEINPTRFQGFGKGASSGGSTDRAYNGAGELNAYDKKDAIAQAVHALDRAQRPLKKASAEAVADKRKVLAAALQTDEGFKMVGQELALPIKAMVDYMSWGNKVLRERSIAQGELFRLAKDVDVPAFVIGQDGQSVETRLHGQYVQPDLTKLIASFSVDILDLYQMNYDVLERGQEKAGQNLLREQDRRVQSILDTASTAVNTQSNFASMSLSVLENLRYQVERHNLIVDKFIMHRQEVKDIQINMSGNLDPVSQRELNLSGYIGRFLGAHIFTAGGVHAAQQVIPAGTLYATTAPEYLGEMGVLVDTFSMPWDKAPLGETVRGFTFCKIMGVVVGNPFSVAKAVKS